VSNITFWDILVGKQKRSAKREDQKNTLLLFMGIGFVAGVILTAFGLHKWSIYRLGSASPADMTVAELSRDGPPKNKHIRLRDCVPTKEYVHLGAKDSANYSQVWLALVVPAGSGGARPRAVVLTSEDVLDEKRMGPMEASVIDGLIVDEDRYLPEEARNLLKMQGSGGDFSSPIVILINGYPSRAKVFGLLGGGIALILPALVFGGWFLATKWSAQREEDAPRRKKPTRRRRRSDDFD
jgi:hypothetical protein